MPYQEPSYQKFVKGGRIVREELRIPSDEELFPMQLRLTVEELDKAKTRIRTLEIENGMIQSRLDELERRVQWLEQNQWPTEHQVIRIPETSS